MHWIAVVVLSTFVAAGNNILDRRLMRARMVPPKAAGASFGIVGTVVAIVGLPLVPPVPWSEALRAVVAGMLFIGAAALYYRVLEEEDVSRVVPLLRLTAVETLLLGALFLDERLSARELRAFWVMVGSGLLLSVQPQGGRWVLGSVLWRTLPITTLLALENVLMAHVLRATSLWAGVVWQNVGYVAGTALLTGLRNPRRFQRRTGVPASGWLLLVLEQGTRFLTGLAPAWAVSQGVPVAVLSALSGLRLAWVWVLAVALLGERAGRKEMMLRGAGILGMSLGVYWLI